METEQGEDLYKTLQDESKQKTSSRNCVTRSCLLQGLCLLLLQIAIAIVTSAFVFSWFGGSNNNYEPMDVINLKSDVHQLNQFVFADNFLYAVSQAPINSENIGILFNNTKIFESKFSLVEKAIKNIKDHCTCNF